MTAFYFAYLMAATVACIGGTAAVAAVVNKD